MNFDELTLERAQLSTSFKWNYYESDVIPSWIADMDFPAAKPIRDFLSFLGETGDLGYAPIPPKDPIFEAFSQRMTNRYAWSPDPSDMECMTDIVQGIYIAVKVLCDDDEQVIINSPMYHPILNACKDMKREILSNSMVKGGEGWEIDFDQLEASITPKSRLLLLVNPHNPSGKVYSRGDLERFADLVLKHNLYVVSDEIHCDLIFLESSKHIPFASLGEDIAKRTVTFNSATKSHNLGGIRCSIAHYGGQEVRQRFDRLPSGMRGGVNSIGPRLTTIAWQQCDDWLISALAYLNENRLFMESYLKNEIPNAKHIPNQATYLAWIDLSDCGFKGDPGKILLEKGRVGCYSGDIFGAEGKGHIRLNFATSRSILKEKLDRIRSVVESR